jgi:hypothetical protein
LLGVWNLEFNYDALSIKSIDFPSEKLFWEAVENVCHFPAEISPEFSVIWGKENEQKLNNSNLTTRAKNFLLAGVEHCMGYIVHAVQNIMQIHPLTVESVSLLLFYIQASHLLPQNTFLIQLPPHPISFSALIFSFADQLCSLQGEKQITQSHLERVLQLCEYRIQQQN